MQLRSKAHGIAQNIQSSDTSSCTNLQACHVTRGSACTRNTIPGKNYSSIASWVDQKGGIYVHTHGVLTRKYEWGGWGGQWAVALHVQLDTQSRSIATASSKLYLWIDKVGTYVNDQCFPFGGSYARQKVKGDCVVRHGVCKSIHHLMFLLTIKADDIFFANTVHTCFGGC